MRWRASSTTIFIREADPGQGHEEAEQHPQVARILERATESLIRESIEEREADGQAMPMPWPISG